MKFSVDGSASAPASLQFWRMMLDSFDIISTTGVILWSKKYAPVSRNVLNGLITEVFIEESVHPGAAATGDGPAAKNPPYQKERHTLKWTTAKDLGLIFVVMIFRSLAQLVTDLLV